jgi:Tol biopolymer transport system component
MGKLSLRHLLHRTPQAGRRGRPGHPPQTRTRAARSICSLAVEQLEDRTVLSTLAAIPVFNPSLPNTASSGGVSQPFISSDGRYIAYTATAPNLVGNQVNTTPEANIFLYDTSNGTTKLISHVPNQPTTTGNGGSSFPVISADDRYVSYSSAATDLVPGQTGPQHGTGGTANVFLYDISAGTNVMVSRATGTGATSGNAASFIEGTTGFGLNQRTGRYLLFLSRATNLVPNQDPAVHLNLFVYDTQLGTTTLVSHAAGNPALGGNDDTLSADIDEGPTGSTIVYTSLATDLVPFQSGAQSNVFLYTTFTNATSLVSGVANPFTGAPSPTVAAGGVIEAAISADGSFIVYTSEAPNLVPGQSPDINPFTGLPYPLTPNLFGFSQHTGQTVLLSGAVDPFTFAPSHTVTCNGLCFRPAVSQDGSSVAFASNASDLYPTEGGAPGQPRDSNVFVDRLSPLNPAQVARELATYDISLPPDPVTGLPEPAGGAVFQAGYNFTDVSISPDGRFVTYQDQHISGQTGPLVPGQTGPDGVRNAFVYQQNPVGGPGVNALLSRVNGTPNVTGNFDTTATRIGGSEVSIAFVSQATNLNPGNVSGTPLVNDGANLFVFPAFSKGPSLLSSQAVVQVSAQTFVWGTSGDGRYVVFTSNSPQVLPGQMDSNADQDTFVFDRTTGTTQLVSHVPGSPLTAGRAGSPSTLSGNGPPGTPVVISQDGNWIAFVSSAPDLVPGQNGFAQTSNVFLFDNRPGPTHGTVTLVSGSPLSPGLTGDGPSFNPVIDAAGDEIAFVSDAKNLIPGLVSNTLGDAVKSNVFVFDRNSRQLTILSDQDSTSTTGNGNSGNPSISDNGRYVTFESFATNLLSGTVLIPVDNIYLSDLRAPQTVLVSHRNSSTTSADASSFDAVISPDGSTVVFVSYATDLVPGQTASGGAGFTNVFLYKNDGSGAVSLVSGSHGSPTFTAAGFSDSPALSADGRRIVFRSDAPDLLPGVTFPARGSNVFLFDRNQPANPVTLLSHAAGNGNATTPAAGASEAPSIDGAGDLVAYLSTATNLVPNQQGGGVENVFLYAVPLSANALLSGQNGSPAVASRSPAFSAILSRDPIAAFNLLTGAGDVSVAFINTLVELILAPNTVADGSPPGTTVGSLSVSSVFAGQFLRLTFSQLPAGSPFFLGATAGNGVPLLTNFAANAAARASYPVSITFNIGLGNSVGVLAVFVGSHPLSLADSGHPLMPELVSVRVGRHRTARLMVEVFDLVTGLEVEALVCPFQAPAYRAITLTPLGNGLFRLSARKGRHTVSILLAV